MNSELKISIYIDEKTKIASLTVDGINIYGEACNFIFTDSKIARALYNRIVMSIYSAGNSAVSDVYEIKKTLNECGEAIKSGIEDSIKSVDIRNGKFVSELEKLYSLKEGYIDDISNPSHYTQGRQYEPRKVIGDWTGILGMLLSIFQELVVRTTQLRI